MWADWLFGCPSGAARSLLPVPWNLAKKRSLAGRSEIERL